MAKPQCNDTWIEDIYQQKSVQLCIWTGFEMPMLSKMTIMIDYFVDSIDLSFFNQYYKYHSKIGGRPGYDYKSLLKLYLYALYEDISMNKLSEHYHLGSNLHYLIDGLPNFPERKVFTSFLKVLDLHSDEIWDLSIKFIGKHVTLDTANLYNDGTVFEAHNNRHKIITDTNLARSNTKWNNVLNDKNSSEKPKEIAKKKLALNIERTKKLEALERTSYGRTDEDCVILMDKNKSFIAGYNVQLVEESNYGFIVYPYISNKNPDAVAFEAMINKLDNKYEIDTITFDTGYGTPAILEILEGLEITPIVKALKNENANKKITEYSFRLSENNDCLICPEGQFLEIYKVNNDKTYYKAKKCEGCPIKEDCCPKAKLKTLGINIAEFKRFMSAKKMVESKAGIEKYSHRGNKCESPNGFIKYNLNGKKLVMDGLSRNKTIIILYCILYNLRRLITVKSIEKNKSKK